MTSAPLKLRGCERDQISFKRGYACTPMEPASYAVIAIIAATLVFGARKRSDLTPVLLLGNLLIFFVEILSAPYAYLPVSSPVVQELAFRPEDLTNGRLYTLFTSMFLHADFVAHLLGNMLFLFLLGTPLEQRIGKARFAAVYFVAGVAGTLIMGLVLAGQPRTLVLGASGAISGLMGALLLLYPRDQIPMILGFLFLPRVPVWLAGLSWLILSVVQYAGLSNSGVAWEAHLAGFIVGVMVAAAVGRREAARRTAAFKPTDIAALEPLAATPALTNALEAIRAEEHPDVRKAWLEYFAEHAQCPQCAGKMKYRDGRMTCPCGYEMVVR